MKHKKYKICSYALRKGSHGFHFEIPSGTYSLHEKVHIEERENRNTAFFLQPPM